MKRWGISKVITVHPDETRMPYTKSDGTRTKRRVANNQNVSLHVVPARCIQGIIVYHWSHTTKHNFVVWLQVMDVNDVHTLHCRKEYYREIGDLLPSVWLVLIDRIIDAYGIIMHRALLLQTSFILFFILLWKDRTYEEIQERPQEPDSGTAIKTIYTTANFHTNPSPDIHYYSNSSFKNSSVEVSAGDPYSTVNNNDQHPTYSTVNHPSGLPDDPCYSTVNNPQQPWERFFTVFTSFISTIPVLSKTDL